MAVVLGMPVAEVRHDVKGYDFEVALDPDVDENLVAA